MPRKGEEEKANAEIEKKAEGKKDHPDTAKAVSNRPFQTEADVCTRIDDCSRLQFNQEKEGRKERKEDNAKRRRETARGGTNEEPSKVQERLSSEKKTRITKESS